MIIYILCLVLISFLFYKYIHLSKVHKVYGKRATTPEELEKGLMYRKDKLKKHEGMLFQFETKINSMWMKNTYIPLDIIFLDKNMKILGYVIDTEPLSEKSLSIDKPSTYVLEMNGNSVFELDMRIGDTIYFVEEIDKNSFKVGGQRYGDGDTNNEGRIFRL